MAGKRKYDQGCAVAHGLDLVGDRWALLVVRDLLLGAKRFTDLLVGLPGISPDVLTQRLRDLADAGVVHRRRLGPPASSWVYELTPWGAGLEPVVNSLAHWASRSPAMPYDAPLSTDSLMVSLKVLFDRDAAAGLNATVALHLGDERFQIRIADGELDVTRGEASEPDTTLETDEETLLSLLRTDRPLDETLAGGELRLVGDPAIAEKFRHLFPLPQPEPAASQSSP
jgi:DNA-binding HxlR family transcriptional regulator